MEEGVGEWEKVLEVSNKRRAASESNRHGGFELAGFYTGGEKKTEGEGEREKSVNEGRVSCEGRMRRVWSIYR